MVSLQKGYPNQLLIYSMKVNIYENEVHWIWVIWANGLKKMQSLTQGRGAETLVFSVPPAALMSVTLVGGI